MLRPLKAIIAVTTGLGALLAAGCATAAPADSQAGMLEQMRAHHRCVEGEMAKRPDGGRSMPGKEQMAAMMQHCPMPAGMRDTMMPMMMNGDMRASAAPPASLQHEPAP